MKIDFLVAIGSGDKDTSFKSMKGERIIIPGFEGFKFFVCYIKRGSLSEDSPEKGEWRITEGETGTKVGAGKDRGEAVSNFFDNCKRYEVTPVILRDRIDEWATFAGGKPMTPLHKKEPVRYVKVWRKT